MLTYKLKKFVPEEQEVSPELAEEIVAKTEGNKDWDTGMANWAIRKIGKENARFDRLIASGEEEIAELQAEIDLIHQKIENYHARKESQTSWLKYNLRMFMLNHPDTRFLKSKTELELVRGFIRIKKSQPKVLRPKELAEDLKAWVKKKREKFFKSETVVKESVDWVNLKKEVEIRPETGDVYDPETKEVIPGLVVEIPREELSIEVKL